MGVGGGVNAAGGLVLAVALLQQLTEEAEGHGRLGGGAGLGDHVDGEIHILHQLHHLRQRLAAETVADEVDVGGVLLFQVIVGGAQALDHAPCTQIGAADADDHQRIGIDLDLFRRRLDALILRPVVVAGQVYPAGKFAAAAIAQLQMAVGDLQPGRHRRLIGQA